MSDEQFMEEAMVPEEESEIENSDLLGEGVLSDDLELGGEVDDLPV